MFSLFCRHLFTPRCITIGITVIFTVGSLPGIAIACEGAGEEPTLSEELKGVGGPCDNMVLRQECEFILMAGTDEIEVEEGRIEERENRSRYTKFLEGCLPREKLQLQRCVDVIKVVREETSTGDQYCLYFKNEVTHVTRIRECKAMSIR